MDRDRAARKRRQEELAALLRAVVETSMEPLTEGVTTVTSAGIDERAGQVVVTLNRRDRRYADDLADRFGELLRVDPEPAVIELIPPAPVTRHPPRPDPR